MGLGGSIKPLSEYLVKVGFFLLRDIRQQPYSKLL